MSNIGNPGYRGLKGLVVPILFASIVAIPVMYYGWNSEWARWRAARGQNEYQSGNTAGGIAMLERAAHQSPHDVDLQLLLAEKLMAHGRAVEAMEIIERVIPLSTNQQPVLRLKANCQLYLSQGKEALKTMKSISDYLTPSDFDRPERMNELAYFRALANEELDVAKDNIREAINIFQVQYWWMDKFPMPLPDQTILAAAMISRKVDRRDLVLELLDRQIERSDGQLYQLELESSEFIYLSMMKEFPLDIELEQQIQTIQQTKLSVKQNLATLIAVRALLQQDLGNREQAIKGRQQVQLLDHSSDEIVSEIPDDWTLLNLMYQGSSFLDTRAMVRHAMSPGHINALRDLDIAVAALELLSLTDEGELQNTIRDDRGTRFQTVELKRSEAVIRLHRSQILTRRGKADAAEKDLRRIEELGFNRNDVLF